MALDKETMLKIYMKPYKDTDGDEGLFKFAKAIYKIGYGDGASNDINTQTNYNRGVKDERERITKMFIKEPSMEWRGREIAEYIRRG